jgi:heme exporter protein CcmD
MMQWMAFGGYGVFVWPCFLLAGVVLVWNALAARRLHARARVDAARRIGLGDGAS